MLTHLRLAFALLLATSGYIFAASSFAQTKVQPAYWVTETLEVMDQAGFVKAIKAVPPIVKAHGGEYIVLGGKIAPGLGTPPSRITIIKFESLERAQRWYNDPAAVSARGEAQKYAKVRDYTVEGVAGPAP